MAAALCPGSRCLEDASHTVQASEGVNLFRPRSNNPPPRREGTQHIQDEQWDQIAQGIRKGFEPDAEETNRVFQLYGLFFFGLGVLIAGIVCWQLWQRRRTEWTLNDPMALIKELNLVHQLSEPEKRFMQELSQQNALPTPLKLFVEPKFLLEALESDSFVSAHSTVRQLLSKLFDMDSEEDEMTAVFTDPSHKKGIL